MLVGSILFVNGCGGWNRGSSLAGVAEGCGTVEGGSSCGDKPWGFCEDGLGDSYSLLRKL